MEPPRAKDVSQSSRKRVVSASASFMDMDPEVIEIPPPVPTASRSKQKQIIIHDIIDIDKEEDSADVIILEDGVDTVNKGKASKNSFDGVALKDSGAENSGFPAMPVPGFLSLSDLEYDFFMDDEYMVPYINDFMDIEMVQDHLDNANIPAGVEASIPWFPEFPQSTNGAIKGSNLSAGSDTETSQSSFAHIKGNANSVSSSEMQTPVEASSNIGGVKSPGVQKKKNYAVSRQAWNNPIPTSGHMLQLSQASSSSTKYNNVSHFNVSPFLEHDTAATVQNHVATAGAIFSGFSSGVSTFNMNHAPIMMPPISLYQQPLKPQAASSKYNLYLGMHDPVDGVNVTPQEIAEIRNQRPVNEEEILRKFEEFKKFDTVEDLSGHHYASAAYSTKQLEKNWAKKIQDEWRILEKDLPDTIFVRVYETRMDLLRAVIVGAEGTPYHDGLFFFDVCFPSQYPNVPPLVHYHSGGLRLNPNLYSCGKVCLSLLNTWSGSKNEKWLPKKSTMLQVLVSIQALILNQKPYFNEPGYERSSGTPQGEMMSHQYNENTFIFSLKTMIYSMKKPPKHFEEFVAGHFYKRAHDILVACKAYMDGAQVGTLVKGGVQDVDEGDKSCSQNFKENVASCVNLLVKEFAKLGVKDCEKFLTQRKSRKNELVMTSPKAAK